MRFIAFIVLALLTSSCDNKGNYLPALPSGTGTGGGAGTAAYASCATPPAGSVDQPGCPTSSGRWNNYEIVYDTSGNVTSNKLYCNGTDQDHPTDQASYDALFAGSTSASDFKIGRDCASGTHVTPMAEIVQNIWRKK